jgi:hypothetical protein
VLARSGAPGARICPNGDLGRLAQGAARTLRTSGHRTSRAMIIDNKVVAFSPTHTAIRLVIPVARRPR